MAEEGESSHTGSDMDIEDELIHMQFFNQVFGSDIQETVCPTGDDMDIEQLESKSTEEDNELDENVFNKSDVEKETDSAKEEDTKQEQLEQKSSKDERPFAETFLEVAPPILITEDFLLNPFDDDNYEEQIIQYLEQTTINKIDFDEDLSTDKWNDIDDAFLKYANKKSQSEQQCSSAASTDNKTGEIVSTGVASKETSSSGEKVTSLPHIVNVEAIKDTGPKRGKGKKSNKSFRPQFMSDINSKAKKMKGTVFDENHPLTSVPKYFDKIVEIKGQRFLKKIELLCIINNDADTKGEEKVAETATASKNKKKRRRVKKKSYDVNPNVDSPESCSLGKDPSSNLGPPKYSEISSAVDTEGDVKNKAVPETLISKGIMTQTEKDAEASPTITADHGSSAVNNLPSSKSRKKRKKKKAASQKNLPGESLPEQKVEELKSESSESDDELFTPELLEELKCVVQGGRPVSRLETDTSSETDEELLFNVKFLEELRRAARGDFSFVK